MKEVPLARKKPASKTSNVRVTDDAINIAHIASGYTGEAMSEYVSRIITQKGTEDIARLHDERFKARPLGKDKPAK
jgi:hypothetical protein